MAKDDDILEEARALFEQCEEREADNRDEALDDLEFARLARQWRVEDEEQRAAEGHCRRRREPGLETFFRYAREGEYPHHRP